MNFPKKIVAIGPESTGKSTLCEQLAEHFGSLWCPEFAREYLLNHGTQYSFEDLLTIAKGQLELEDKYVSKAVTTLQKMLFIDTDMYVMKVWAEFVFNRCHRYILEQIVQRKYDLYLLCNTDLPWVKDELREYPDLKTRQKLFYVYKDLLINQEVPWVEIKGNEGMRLQSAIEAVGKLQL
jgi:NadR type nicotinamide-nucleotide adenylyltransferase